MSENNWSIKNRRYRAEYADIYSDDDVWDCYTGDVYFAETIDKLREEILDDLQEYHKVTYYEDYYIDKIIEIINRRFGKDV